MSCVIKDSVGGRSVFVYVPQGAEWNGWLTCSDARAAELRAGMHADAGAGRAAVAMDTVVALHPFGGNGFREIRRFTALAEAHGSVIVAPQGTGNARSWNGRDCCGDAVASGVDDVGFVESVVDMVLARYPATAADRLGVRGSSNGGYLTSWLHLQPTTRFRAFAPVVGIQTDLSLFAADRFPEPRPILIFYSTGDQVVLYGGCCAASKCCCDIRKDEAVCTSVVEVFEALKLRNGCSGESAFALATADATGLTGCVQGTGCAAPTRLCTWTLAHMATAVAAEDAVHEFLTSAKLEELPALAAAGAVVGARAPSASASGASGHGVPGQQLRSKAPAAGPGADSQVEYAFVPRNGLATVLFLLCAMVAVVALMRRRRKASRSRHQYSNVSQQ